MSQWYENRVGDEFDAIETKTLYRVQLTNKTGGLVNKEDAEIIKKRFSRKASCKEEIR